MRGVLEVSRISADLACSYSAISRRRGRPELSTPRHSALIVVSPQRAGYRVRSNTATPFVPGSTNSGDVCVREPTVPFDDGLDAEVTHRSRCVLSRALRYLDPCAGGLTGMR